MNRIFYVLAKWGFKCFLTEIIQDRVAGRLMAPRYFVCDSCDNKIRYFTYLIYIVPFIMYSAL